METCLFDKINAFELQYNHGSCANGAYPTVTPLPIHMDSASLGLALPSNSLIFEFTALAGRKTEHDAHRLFCFDGPRQLTSPGDDMCMNGSKKYCSTGEDLEKKLQRCIESLVHFITNTKDSDESFHTINRCPDDSFAHINESFASTFDDTEGCFDHVVGLR